MGNQPTETTAPASPFPANSQTEVAGPSPFTDALKAAAGVAADVTLPAPVAETVKRRVSKSKRAEKRVHMALDLLTVTVTIHVKGPDQEKLAATLEIEASKLVRACFG